MKKITTKEFIEEAKKVHGNKYDYSKVTYTKAKEKICIICPIHGEFWQTPDNHIHGKKCPKCRNRIKKTTEQFIKEARKIHGNKYDYKKVEYVNNSTKVCIICPIHGEFWQTPKQHLKGHGCPKCAFEKNKDVNRGNLEEFIQHAKGIHGDRYDYSKVEYVNNRTKVCIICKEHGEFWQKPYNHLSGKGCPKCANKNMTTIDFILKSKKIHGDKYDYSKAEYKDSHTNVCIICTKHGKFYISPNSHLSGCGCNKCGEISRILKRTSNVAEFLEKAKKIHGDRYDYSKVEYINSSTKICIICKEHGEFWQTPNEHLSGHGCPKCSGRNKSTYDFIKQAKEVHCDKYDYSKSEYVNSKTKICIICKKHGEFWQDPSNHLNGMGCPKCKESKLEKQTRNVLEDNKIVYEYQKKFEWLGKQSLDFYLPSHNIAIECQGEQHYKPVDFAGKGNEWAKKIFEKNKIRDKIKLDKVLKHNIKMIYVNEENKDNFLNEIL